MKIARSNHKLLESKKQKVGPMQQVSQKKESINLEQIEDASTRAFFSKLPAPSNAAENGAISLSSALQNGGKILKVSEQVKSKKANEAVQIVEEESQCHEVRVDDLRQGESFYQNQLKSHSI